jgi:chromosome segregation ATPase
VTNPARRQAPVPVPDVPQTTEPRVVSTADDQEEETPRRTSRTRREPAPAQPSESERLRGTVDRLSTQVDKLAGDVTAMKSDQRALFELERLTRAEQRAEALRSQLRDVTDREFQLQERMAQVNDELQPDAILRRAALFGTTNPSVVRDQIRQGLERERDRLQKQLDMLAQSRTRLEAAVASADREVDQLRQRVEGADQQQQPGAPATTTDPATIPETPAPTPTPTPAQPPQ